MKNKKKNLILLAVLFFATGFFGFGKVYCAGADHIIINQIQTAGSSANDEWVELYNPTNATVDITGWSIQYRGGGGAGYYKKNFENGSMIPAKHFFLIAHGGTGNYAGTTAFDMSWSQALSSTGGTIFLVDNQTLLIDGKSSSVVDRVSYGSGIYLVPENLPAIKPESNQSIERKNFQDTDDNNTDFNLPNTPTPRNSSYGDSVPEPEPAPEPEPIIYSDQIIINEILPAPQSGVKEFVEFYNSGDETVDLEKWRLRDKNLENKSIAENKNISCILPELKIEPKKYTAFYLENCNSYNITLNNDGDELNLYNPVDIEPVSNVSYLNAEGNYSYSFDGTDWQWTSFLTPGEENKFTEDINYPDKLFISEFLPNPSNSPEKDFEYVEIFNSEEKTVDLSGWKLKDKSSSYTLAGLVDSKGFIIFYDTVSLNNGGDEIQLVNPLDKVVHTVSYEEAKENYSYSWKESENKWKWTSWQTPGAKNIFDEDIEYPKGLYLSEILPNPDGEEEKKEFIEIYNPLDKDVDLEKWILKDSGKTTKYVFPKDSEIGKKKYLVIYREDFKFALNNSGDENVYLLNPNEETVSSVSYSDANEGVSYNFDGKIWRWSKYLTPGKENKFNKLPKIEVDMDDDIYLDIYADFRVKVNDPEKEKVKVIWDFGDGHKSYKKETRHKYEKKGEYKVTVKIFDGSEEITKEYKAEVKKFPHREVKIRSLCPNPAGNDSENEWILVKNYSDHSVNLKGWSVASGSKKLYNHPIYEDFEIKKGKTKKLTRDDSNFTLNNEKSKVELRYPDGEVAYKVKYEKKGGAEEDEVYEKGENGWQWLNTRTNADITRTNADATQTNAESFEEGDFSEFIDGQSAVELDKISREELLNYGTQVKLAAAVYSGEGKVLGVSTENYNEPVYRFAESAPGEHYAMKFFKNILKAINYLLNKLISSFY